MADKVLQRATGLPVVQVGHTMLILPNHVYVIPPYRSLALALWEADADGMVVEDSPSWRAYTGQTPAAWLGEGWLDAVHPEDRAQAGKQWREAVARRGVVDAVFRLSRPEGGWRWTRVRAEPLFNVDGSVRKWVGMNIEAVAKS